VGKRRRISGSKAIQKFIRDLVLGKPHLLLKKKILVKKKGEVKRTEFKRNL
jgi:hypothetical protein